jgi:hypothetical protein
MRGRAIVIATSQCFEEPELEALPSVVADAEGMQEVLGDPKIGNFSVAGCLNAPAQKWRLSLDDFFADSRKDELLLLYISGHGIKDDDGRLYFAASDTRKSRLKSTGVAANFIHDVANAGRGIACTVSLAAALRYRRAQCRRERLELQGGAHRQWRCASGARI